MPVSVSKYLPRHKGMTKILDFDDRPICKYCKQAMKIVKTYIIGPIVGLSENYYVQKRSYRCGKALCSGGEDPPNKVQKSDLPSKERL
jgi:hypothetical protein